MDKNGFSFNSLETEETGYVMSGPYFRLGPGFYEMTFHMSGSLAEKSEKFLGMIDVAADSGNSVISSVQWDRTSQSITMRFCLQEKTNNIEFRYFKYRGNDTFPTEVSVKS